MLGFDTFSQTSFDSIPTFPVAYFTNVAESTTSSDSLSATAYFYTTTTDSISTTDSDIGNFNFYETVSESYIYPQITIMVYLMLTLLTQKHLQVQIL